MDERGRERGGEGGGGKEVKERGSDLPD